MGFSTKTAQPRAWLTKLAIVEGHSFLWGAGLDCLTSSDYGTLGAIESEAQRIWTETGVDVYQSLLETYAKRLQAMATRAIGKNPKGGRPNKHTSKLFRSKRPEKEMLMPHGLEEWPVRAPEPYLKG